MRVASLTEGFAAKAGLPQCGRLVGGLHDFGKYSEEFQIYLLSAAGLLTPGDAAYVDAAALKGKVIHAFAGGQRIWRHWGNGHSVRQAVAQMLALSVISHHSGLKDCIAPNGDDVFKRCMDSPEERAHHDHCAALCDLEVSRKIDKLLEGPAVLREASDKLAGLYNRMNDKGKDVDNVNSRAVQQGLLARFLLSCLLDADRTDSVDFEDPHWRRHREQLPRRPWDRLVERLEAHVAGLAVTHPIDSLRRDISAACARRASDPQGFFTLTVPTGGGKTLASLRFALRHAQQHNLDRVVYVIPYTSIIDQNADEARKILEQGEIPGSIVLEHHSNFLSDAKDSEAEDAVKRWEKLAENWDAPVVFTTMVQFLESLFGAGTRHPRRMHNLARSVLVFDEVQTLPLKCVHLFCNAVDFLVHECGSSTVLCTATQPGLGDVPRPLRGSLPLSPQQEIMPAVPKLFRELRRTQFLVHCERTHTAAEVAALAGEELRAYGACLVICNTKVAAEHIYTLCTTPEGTHRYHLSTRLCPAHRLRLIKAMRKKLENNVPVLCVSTQLVECGVDISFPSVIRLAAGLDSVLQAAGRCNRHGGPRRGRVHVLKMEETGLGKLPDIRRGQDIFLDMLTTHKDVLDDSGMDFTQPALVEEYFKTYFHQLENTLSYAVDKSKRGMVRDDTLLNMLGSNTNATSNGDAPFLRQSFATAADLFEVIEKSTTAVIVPYGEEGRDLVAELCSTAFLSRKKELLRQAQRYSVNLFSHELDRLNRAGALKSMEESGILLLREGFYHEKLGVVPEATGEMPVLIFTGRNV